MSQTRETRTRMSSSQLDFEGVEGGDSPTEDFFQLFADDLTKPKTKETAPRNLRPLSSMAYVADEIRSSNVGRTAPKKTLPAKKTNKQDDTTKYLASAVLLCFIVAVLLVLWYVRRPPINEAGLAYGELPETVIYMGDQVIRLQANIQVDSDDKEWLAQHREQINGVLQKLLSNIDPETLRTPEGLADVQNNLAPQLNKELKVDKIQAVLLTTLLLQNRG